jgi:hypothetical protein
VRYFKIYDYITPEGQLYRENEDGSLSVENVPGKWDDSIFTDIEDLRSGMSKGDRLEELEGE